MSLRFLLTGDLHALPSTRSAAVPGSGDEEHINLGITKAFAVDGTSAVSVCVGYCLLSWDTGGGFVYLSYPIRAGMSYPLLVTRDSGLPKAHGTIPVPRNHRIGSCLPCCVNRSRSYRIRFIDCQYTEIPADDFRAYRLSSRSAAQKRVSLRLGDLPLEDSLADSYQKGLSRFSSDCIATFSECGVACVAGSISPVESRVVRFVQIGSKSQPPWQVWVGQKGSAVCDRIGAPGC
jgi:hypothetical protein